MGQESGLRALNEAALTTRMAFFPLKVAISLLVAGPEAWAPGSRLWGLSFPVRVPCPPLADATTTLTRRGTIMDTGSMRHLVVISL